MAKNIISEKGFTLIELLLVMGIISMLSSAVFFNRHQATDIQALNQATQRLVFDIRRAQTLALSGVGLDIDNGKCGYGINIPNNATYNISLYNCTNGIINNSEIITLSKGITISSVAFPTFPIDILFKPPKPYIVINNTPALTSIEIKLTNPQNQTKIIEINTSGQVNIK